MSEDVVHARVLSESFQEDMCDNMTDLIRALRKSRADPERAVALDRIVSKCDTIVSVCTTPGYKHPMRCCCCGRWTELDLKTGIRVLQSKPTEPHYVCEILIPFLVEQEKSGEYESFPTFKTVLVDLAKKLYRC